MAPERKQTYRRNPRNSKEACGRMNEISWRRIKFGDDEIQRLIDSVNDEHIKQGPVG